MEGAAVFALSLLLYQRSGGAWLLFALLLFTPDLAMAGYLGGPRLGALCYNLVHSYTLPLGLGALSLVLPSAPLAWGAMILGAHIGLDRALGYGLKLPGGFRDTHLGRIGASRLPWRPQPDIIPVPADPALDRAATPVPGGREPR